MAKFYGAVGYAVRVESAQDVWTDSITERNYYGDVIRNTRRLENGEHLNDEINVNNQISIIGDAFSSQNIFAIRYVQWAGARWKVTNVDVQAPRLILTLGGVYNGPTPIPGPAA